MTEKLRQFVREVESALSVPHDEPLVLARVCKAMKGLVAVDDWLAAEFTVPHPQFYQQYLLHGDPQKRFSVVSFVWGPGQQTPIHDHTVWGVIGMLRGAELGQSYRCTDSGMVPYGPQERLEAGEISAVSPRIGDIHRVTNAHKGQISISIHVYGTDIGSQRRHVFDPKTGASTEFVSGYANIKKAIE